ncbi:IS1380 family transposase [Candidatus Binatia bacterium]|nr:IS1380 family transposase [Candidatus Binatia bacterium]
MRDRDAVVWKEQSLRLATRLHRDNLPGDCSQPMLAGSNVRYEISARIKAMPCGGIGLIHEMVRAIGLAESIDERVHVFKRHFPYHESDHVLNLAYNVLCGGTRLEDLERLRGNEAYLDTLGCERVPDPTTAGDFLRRFGEHQVMELMAATNAARVKVWKKLSKKDRALALIDVDGTIAPTTGECKEGMDISYKGIWGYAPLVITLANTEEVLFIKNRSGNAPSHSGAVAYMDEAVALVRAGGFRRVRLRGDTDFSLTANFDRWTEDAVEFVFGMDAQRNVVELADGLSEKDFRPLVRWAAAPATRPRQRPENIKEIIVHERGYQKLILEEEHVAEVAYRPSKCKRSYRLIIVRKKVRVEQGQQRLFDQTRYLFYITNVHDDVLAPAQVVFEANDRCAQENIIEQLKNGVQAFRMPSDALLSNWAYAVIATLAWNLRIWMSILLPKRLAGQLRRMEHRRFLHSVMLVPCQVVRTARQMVLRILTYSPWAELLTSGTDYFHRWRTA